MSAMQVKRVRTEEGEVWETKASNFVRHNKSFVAAGLVFDSPLSSLVSVSLDRKSSCPLGWAPTAPAAAGCGGWREDGSRATLRILC